MNVAEIMSRFSQIDQHRQEMGRWEKQLQELETAVRQLENTRQQWFNQIKWRDGLTLTLAELRQLQQQIEDDEQRWTVTHGQQKPETALAKEKTAVQQAESRIRTLTEQGQALEQLETLWARWMRVTAKQTLARQIATLEAQWEAEGRQEATLLNAYDQLQALATEIQAEKERYTTIEAMIQELDQAIAGDQKEAWLALAFTNINRLSQEIGDRLHTIEEKSQTSGAELEALQREAIQTDQSLEPNRQRVATLQAEEKSFRESFAGLPQELCQWGQDSRRLKMSEYVQLSKVDGESETELEALRQRMNSELHHLQWFQEQVVSL